MGWISRLAARVNSDVASVEADMASDPSCPPDLLTSLAKERPDLIATIRRNPACPSELKSNEGNEPTDGEVP
jgi:hypothetical protein